MRFILLLSFLLASLVFAGDGHEHTQSDADSVEEARDPRKSFTSWASQAANDVKHELDKIDLSPAGDWLEQAGKNIKHEFDKIDLGDAGKWAEQAGQDVRYWTEQAVKDVKRELDRVDLGEVDAWLKKADLETDLKRRWDGIRAINLEDLPEEILRHIKENPEQTAFRVVDGLVFFAPHLVPGPALALLGLKAGRSRFGQSTKSACNELAGRVANMYTGSMAAKWVESAFAPTHPPSESEKKARDKPAKHKSGPVKKRPQEQKPKPNKNRGRDEL